MQLPPEQVRGRTLYLGDAPRNLLDWVNGFSRALTNREVRIIPRFVMRTLAVLGDVPTVVSGKAFLINSSRYRSMITDYETPMQPTFELLGENPYTLEEGIAQTVEWLRSYQGPIRRVAGFRRAFQLARSMNRVLNLILSHQPASSVLNPLPGGSGACQRIAFFCFTGANGPNSNGLITHQKLFG